VVEGMIKDQEKVAALIKELIGKGKENHFSTKYAVMSLPETKTFIKVIEIQQEEDDKESIRSILQRELPRHVPIEMAEAQIDWQEMSGNGKTRKFLIGAVEKTVADEYVKVAELAGLEVAALEIEAQAIVRSVLPVDKRKEEGGFFKLKRKPEKNNLEKINAPNGPKIILDMGATRTSLIMFDQETIQFTNSFPNISGRKITEKIVAKTKLPFGEAEKAKIICGINPKKCKGAILEIIKDTIDELIKEVVNAEEFYQTHFGGGAGKTEIILCGGGSNLSNLAFTLKDKTKREITIADPLINTAGLASKEGIKDILSHTTSIGLALRNYV
jgi:type IV pilus assembly protein PilM